MKTKMKNLIKNNNMQPNKMWLITVQLIVLSLFLVLSQLTLAKDRIQYHVQNFDGSTLKVINEQGVVSQSYQYAPFGQQLQYKKPNNLKNPNAFVGGVQDADDLVYLKQRHYNPVLGRFYQPDPVTFIINGDGQLNRYHYAWNDSYTFSDPNGLNPARALVPLTAAEMQSYSLALSIDAKNLGVMIKELQRIHNLSNGLMLAGGISTGNKTKEGIYAIGDLTQNHIDKAWKNIDRLISKSQYDDPNDNNYAVYALVATKAGYFPSVRGSGQMYLNAGDVWKYGQTTKDGRYPSGVNIYFNLRQQTLATGSEYKVRAYEQILIVSYGVTHGYLPPGNKIIR